MTPRPHRAANAGLALILAATMSCTAIAAGRSQAGAAGADTTPTTGTTTTTVAPTTTTTTWRALPPITPGPTAPPATAAPPTAAPVTSGPVVTPPAVTTVPPTTTTSTTSTTVAPVDTAKLMALLRGLDGDMARAQAIAAYQAARAAAAAMAAGQPPDVATDPVLLEAAATQLRATAARAAAQDQFDQSRRRINQVAVALYVGILVPSDTGPLSGSVATRSMMLSAALDGERAQLRTARGDLSRAKDAYEQSRRRADDLVNARTAFLQARMQSLASTSTTASPSPTAPPAGPSTTAAANSRPVTTLPPDVVARSPTILGPSLLAADELLGWYNASGHQPQLTVPLADLVKEYETRGVIDGVRADMAFAQAVLETGYLAFPSFGQVSASDNNFAGIGACDSCATGSRFPDAGTGVAAHLQLLHAYATPAPLAGPLPGPIWVTGCCPTWLGLTGVWATAPGYGYSILRTYRSMVIWALGHRSASAGL